MKNLQYSDLTFYRKRFEIGKYVVVTTSERNLYYEQSAYELWEIWSP